MEGQIRGKRAKKGKKGSDRKRSEIEKQLYGNIRKSEKKRKRNRYKECNRK